MGQQRGPPSATGSASSSSSTRGAAAAAEMKKRKAIRILLCQPSPVKTGERFHLDVQVRIPCDCRLLDVSATLEGRCRAAFDGHDNLQSLVSQSLDLRPLSNYVARQPEKDKEKKTPPSDREGLVIPAGIHRVVVPVVLPRELPGTFKARHGAIAYRAIVKISSHPKGEESLLEGDKTIDVVGSIPLDSFPRHDKPVLIDQHFVRSFLCFSRLDVKVNAEMERSAYRTGEHVLLAGTIENGASSSTLKTISLELRQMTLYTNGTSKKTDNRLITSLSCGTCDVDTALKLHHSMQIPANVYPSLVNPNSAVQVFYELHLTGNGDRFRVEIPLFVGNSVTPSPSSSGRKSRPQSGSFTQSPCSSSFGSSSAGYPDDTTFASSISDDRDSRCSQDFVRIHAPPPPFMPSYGIRQMPPFLGPRFGPSPLLHGHGHPAPPPPPYKPFLKIQEITDDE